MTLNGIIYKQKTFVDGQLYMRTDGGNWFRKKYNTYQKLDVKVLIPQGRIKVTFRQHIYNIIILLYT